MKVSQNIASQNSVNVESKIKLQKVNEKFFIYKLHNIFQPYLLNSNMATSGHLVYHTNIMSQMIIAKI